MIPCETNVIGAGLRHRAGQVAWRSRGSAHGAWLSKFDLARPAFPLCFLCSPVNSRCLCQTDIISLNTWTHLTFQVVPPKHLVLTLHTSSMSAYSRSKIGSSVESFKRPVVKLVGCLAWSAYSSGCMCWHGTWTVARQPSGWWWTRTRDFLPVSA